MRLYKPVLEATWKDEMFSDTDRLVKPYLKLLRNTIIYNNLKDHRSMLQFLDLPQHRYCFFAFCATAPGVKCSLYLGVSVDLCCRLLTASARAIYICHYSSKVRLLSCQPPTSNSLFLSLVFISNPPDITLPPPASDPQSGLCQFKLYNSAIIGPIWHLRASVAGGSGSRSCSN